MENTIKNILKNEYNLYCAEYGKEHILGTFIIGAANYGFAETIKEIDCVTIYLPSFEEVCNAEYKKPLTEYYLTDIRDLYNSTKDGYNVLEILFSDYCIITDKYKNVFDAVLEKREKISRSNQARLIKNMYNRAEAIYNCAYQNGECNSSIYEVVRLYISASRFISGTPCNDCYHISDPIYTSYIWSCKKNPSQDEIFKILTEFQELVENFEAKPDCEGIKLIKEGVVNIMGYALYGSTSIDVFLEELTETEKKAFEVIKSKLVDGVGTIIISKIIDETNISRPVWKNLLLKMENNKIAKITNRGVKGTLIEMEV